MESVIEKDWGYEITTDLPWDHCLKQLCFRIRDGDISCIPESEVRVIARIGDTYRVSFVLPRAVWVAAKEGWLRDRSTGEPIDWDKEIAGAHSVYAAVYWYWVVDAATMAGAPT